MTEINPINISNMKKRILIFSAILIILSLTAYGFTKWNDAVAEQNNEIAKLDKQVVKKLYNKEAPRFFYAVGTRFGAIKKEDIDKAKSIDDFLDVEQMDKIVYLKSTSVIIIINDEQSEIRESGNSKTLNRAQLKLLQSSDYSTNFIVRVEYRQMNKEIGELEDSYSTPHLTIVPEKQAVYVSGEDALIDYLRKNSKEPVALVDEDKLKPAKLYFTVTKEGAISNLKLDRTSGDTSIDAKMVELIKNLPGKWEPAENSKGKKVDQELVFSFGLMGC